MELNIKPFNLPELIPEVVDHIRHISTNHAIEIYNEYNCTVSGDKTGLSRWLIICLRMSQNIL